MKLSVVGLVLFAVASFAPLGAQESLWSVERVTVAGSIDGPAALTDIFDVEVAPDGRILVAQTSIGTIAEFQPDGTYLRSIGRLGPGPGEFRVLGRLGWAQDTLWVVDFGRVHLFTHDLTFIRTLTIQLDQAPTAGRTIPGPLMSDGNIVFFTMLVGNDQPVPITLATRQGEAIRKLADASDGMRSHRLALPNGQRVTLADPWPSHTLWVQDPDGESIVLVNRRSAEAGSAAMFEVLRIGLSGDTLMRRRISYTPRPIDQTLSNRRYAELGQRLGGRPDMTPARAEQVVRDQVSFPRFVPPVSELVLGRDGTTWLRREHTRSGNVEWQILDQRGESIGRLRLPAATKVYRAQSDRLWAVETDALDIPFVVVYDVHANG